MRTEFTKAILPDEIRRLLAFDRKVFPSSDCFTPAYWRICESYWMLVDGKTVGCCAFEEHMDFRHGPSEDDIHSRLPGSLYVSTTGILPKFRNLGFGLMLKSWEISYARYHGFTRIVTNMRKRNARMIAINETFGFRVVRTIPRYYSDPVDSTVVMELLLD